VDQCAERLRTRPPVSPDQRRRPKASSPVIWRSTGLANSTRALRSPRTHCRQAGRKHRMPRAARAASRQPAIRASPIGTLTAMQVVFSSTVERVDNNGACARGFSQLDRFLSRRRCRLWRCPCAPARSPERRPGSPTADAFNLSSHGFNGHADLLQQAGEKHRILCQSWPHDANICR
jgi:hypothetical protein